MLFVSVDVVIMVIVTGFSGTRLQPVQVPDKEFPSGFNVMKATWYTYTIIMYLCTTLSYKQFIDCMHDIVAVGRCQS